MNYILNETKVRTSKNFKINNIEIDDLEILDHFKEFTSFKTEYIDTIKDCDDKCEFKNSLGIEEVVKDKINNTICMSFNNDTKKAKLHYLFNEENKNLASNIIVKVKENVNVDLTIKINTESDLKAFCFIMLNVILENNAYLNLTILNFLNNKSTFLSKYQVEESVNSKLNINVIDLGAKNVVSNLYVNARSEGSKVDVNTMYLGVKEEIIDYNYVIDLFGKGALANIDAKGALLENAVKHFKGTLDFKKGAVKAKGNEDEFCYLLSNKAKSISLPMLLCTEEDVEGNHACASGKIDENILFYLLSRGFSKKEAMRIIVKAKMNHMLENFEEDLREEITSKIDNILV